MNHITTKFERLAAYHSIEDFPDMANLAEAFYDAGISAALQQSNCKEAVLTHGYQQSATCYKNLPKYLEHTQSALTQTQVQQLSHVLRTILNEFDKNRQECKYIVRNLWDKCNPLDPETQVEYTTMNRYKAIGRELKHTTKKLSEIQRVLKKLQKQG